MSLFVDTSVCCFCIRHDLALLTTDPDFTHAAVHGPLKIRGPAH